MEAKWHVIAVAIHLCMGLVNIVFWNHVFVQFNQMVPAYVTTIGHWTFVVTQGAAFLVARTSTPRPEHATSLGR